MRDNLISRAIFMCEKTNIGCGLLTVTFVVLTADQFVSGQLKGY